MNVAEGVRRIGLVAGGVGTCCGLFVSYLLFVDLNQRRLRHDEFQTIVSSPVVKNEVAHLKGEELKAPKPPPGYVLDEPNLKTSESTSKSGFRPPPISSWEGPSENFDAMAALAGSNNGWTMNKAGIKTLRFGSKEDVVSVEKEDGQKIDATDAPGVIEYLPVLGAPIASFLIPWGLFVTLRWVVAGFRNT